MTTRAPTPKRFIVAGAGLAGSLLALALARRGHHVQVFERRPDPRASGFAGGRSINLALSVRGVTALERFGVADRVLQDVIPMRGRMMHSPSGHLAFQPYSRIEGEAINSVSRGGLNKTLLSAAEQHENVRIRFAVRCLDVDFNAPRAHFRDDESGEEFSAEADAIIGTDGAFSAVRGAMQKTDRFNYSQTYLEHGYKELHIPATPDGRHAMEPNALHIWPRGGSMMIALPNPDKSFTCTLFWPYEGEHSFAAVRTRADVRPFFERHYPDAAALMPTLEDDFDRNPTSSLVTIRCSPWVIGRVALLGDASHAIVPFYGQGMNAAFEDVRVLDECLLAHDNDLDAALAAYQAARIDNANAIADMALDNFIEMRDKVASPAFRTKKRLEKIVHKMFPNSYTPLYNMVSFSNIPYAEALRRSRRRARLAQMFGGAVGGAAILLLVAALLWQA
jgi:kynurenine 3-monooxygenase